MVAMEMTLAIQLSSHGYPAQFAKTVSCCKKEF